jgi:hypothetical protein
MTRRRDNYDKRLSMRFRAPVADPRQEDILELEPMLRRVVGARVRDPDTVDDLVQEARLRLDYLLALRRVDRLPTARCRPVLLALSAGDRRRQLALDAGGHLMQCPTCASLSRPLVERRRSIAVLLPLVALWWLWRRIQAWAQRKPVLASLAAVSAATVTGLVLVPPLVERDQAPRPAPTTTTTLPPPAGQGQAVPGGGGGGSGVRLVVPGRSLLPVPGREVLARHAGQRVRGINVPTRGVYADEGFWVGTGGVDQLWVQLVGRGESPFKVRPGQWASFTGRLVPSPPGFAERVGMVPTEGAALSGRQAHHIEVAYDDMTVEP